MRKGGWRAEKRGWIQVKEIGLLIEGFSLKGRREEGAEGLAFARL